MPLPVVLLLLLELPFDEGLLHDLLGEDGHLLGRGDPGLLGGGGDGEVGGTCGLTWEHEWRHSSGWGGARRTREHHVGGQGGGDEGVGGLPLHRHQLQN